MATYQQQVLVSPPGSNGIPHMFSSPGTNGMHHIVSPPGSNGFQILSPPGSNGLVIAPGSNGMQQLSYGQAFQAPMSPVSSGPVSLYHSSGSLPYYPEGPSQILVPIYQEPPKIRVAVFHEAPKADPAPKLISSSPKRGSSQERSGHDRKGHAERAMQEDEIEETIKVKILEVERLVEVPVEVLVQVPVERMVIKILEVPVDREKIVVKEVDKEPKIITQEVIKQVEVIKEVPVIVYRDRPEPKKELRSTGLGMRLERELGTKGTALTIVDSIVPGYAAHWSGLIRTGDILEAITEMGLLKASLMSRSVDGTDVMGWNLDAIKQLTVGLEGSTCKCRFRRETNTGPHAFEATLTRVIPEIMREGTDQMEAEDAYRSVGTASSRNSYSGSATRPNSGTRY